MKYHGAIAVVEECAADVAWREFGRLLRALADETAVSEHGIDMDDCSFVLEAFGVRVQNVASGTEEHLLLKRTRTLDEVLPCRVDSLHDEKIFGREV